MLDTQFLQFPLCGFIHEIEKVQTDTRAAAFEDFKILGAGQEDDDFIAHEYTMLKYRCSKAGKLMKRTVKLPKHDKKYGTEPACALSNDEILEMGKDGRERCEINQSPAVEL